MWQATNPVHTFTFPSLLYRFYEERKSLCLVVARQYQELSPEILFHLVWLKSVQFEPFVCFWSFSYFSQNLLFSHTDTQTQTHTVDTDTDKQTDRLTDTQTDRQTHHFFFHKHKCVRAHTHIHTDRCVCVWVGGWRVCVWTQNTLHNLWKPTKISRLSTEVSLISGLLRKNIVFRQSFSQTVNT